MFQTFLAVARSGSFAAAADSECLTPSAISLQMNALEMSLKRRLFEKRGRQMVLTTEAADVLPQVELMLSLYRNLHRGEAPATVPLRIGAIVSVMKRLSLSVANYADDGEPQPVRLTTAQSDGLARMVTAGELDAAILVSPSTYGATENWVNGMTWTPLYVEPLVLVCSGRRCAADPLALLREQPFIRFDDQVRTGRLIARTLERSGVAVRDALTLNSLEAVLALVRQDKGVAIVPHLRWADWDADPTLRVLEVPQVAGVREVGLLEGSRIDAASRRFLVELSRRLMAEQPG